MTRWFWPIVGWTLLLAGAVAIVLIWGKVT